MTTTSRPLRADRSGIAGLAARRRAGGRAALRLGQGRAPWPAARRPAPSRFMWPCTLDLSTKSRAPSSRPRRVTSAPSLVSEESSSTGVGHSLMMRRSASRPSMRGILTSSVTTSGRSASAFSSPSWPSTAVPTTSMSGAPPSIRVRALRTKAESSTTSTRIMRRPRARRGARGLVDHGALEADGQEEVGDARQRLRVAQAAGSRRAPGARGRCATTRRIIASEK